MRKLVLVLALVLFLTSCVVYVEDRSMHDCGVVVGGERRFNEYWLLVSYPDGEWWEEVTQRTYYSYDLFDTICFDTITW